MLRARDPGIDGRILAGTLDPTLPLVVVTDMVRAAVSGPDPGVQSETTGPFTVRWSTAAATGRLVLTAEQLASLQPAGLSTGRPRWLGQIGVRRGPL